MSTSNRLRVAGYVRVSTDAQARDETQEVQVEWLKKLAKEQAWDLELFDDSGISGETIAARPAFQRLLSEVERGKFDAVAAKRIDRLCRSAELDAWAILFNAVRRGKARIITEGRSYDLNDIEASFMLTVMGPGVAGLEKALILKRTREGMDRALRAGRKPHGTDPLGLHYVRERREFEIVEQEAQVVRRAFELADLGLSSRDVADRLRDEGFVGRTGKPLPYGQTWRMLRSATYRGEWNFEKGVVRVPPIVPPDIWARVAGRLASRKTTMKPRKGEEVHELAGLAWCSTCGLPAHAINTGRSRTAYLVCASAHKHYRLKGHEPCRGSWRRDHVRDEVWKMVCGLLDSTDLQRRIETAGDRVDEPGAVLDAEIAGLETRLAALLKKEEGLVERWRRGLISDQVFDPSLERSKVERGRLAAELERRRGDWERLQQAVSPEGGEKLIDRVRTNLEAATSEERALVLRTLCPIHQQHGIYLHPDGGVELRAVIPISEAQRLCRTAAPPCSSPP